MPAGVSNTELRLENFDTYGRPVGYATNSKGQEPLFNWLRENPHRPRRVFWRTGARIEHVSIEDV